MKLFLFIVIAALFCATVKSSESSPLIPELFSNENSLDIVHLFQCLIDVVRKVSNENGFSKLWSQSEPAVKYHLNKWLKCPQAGDKLAVVRCNIREGTQVMNILQKYFKLVAARNPLVILLITLEYNNRCSSVGFIDSLLPQIPNEEEILYSDMDQ